MTSGDRKEFYELRKDPNKPDVPWDALTNLLTKAMAGIPCTNQENLCLNWLSQKSGQLQIIPNMERA
jgi:hypothetical protein